MAITEHDRAVEYDQDRQDMGESLAGCAARHMLNDTNMLIGTAGATVAVSGPAVVLIESAGLAAGIGVALPVIAITGAGIDFVASAVECYVNRHESP